MRSWRRKITLTEFSAAPWRGRWSFKQKCSPVSHMNSVVSSDELREAHDACLPLLSEYGTWVGQHEGLYNAYASLKASDEFATLSEEQKVIENAVRDFTLSGEALAEQKSVLQRFKQSLASYRQPFPTMWWTPLWAGLNTLPMKLNLPVCQSQPLKQRRKLRTKRLTRLAVYVRHSVLFASHALRR